MIHLTSVTERETNGLSGLISHHYYLCGRDETGKKIWNLKISSDEFYGLKKYTWNYRAVLFKNRANFKFVDDK